jgi:hypothetical protein
MNEGDVLGQLVGASPRRLLEELGRTGAVLARNDRARPEVEVYLGSGQMIRGRIISVADDRQGAVALLVVGGSPRGPSVTFIRVDQIAAVTVIDASLLVKPPTADLPVPSKLELQRQAAAGGEALASQLGHPLSIQLGSVTELDDEGRAAMGGTLPLLFDVLTAIALDDLGREALKGLDVIELGSASAGEVTRADKRLVVRAPKLVAEQYTHASLRKAIEKLL